MSEHSWATRSDLNRNEQWKLAKDGLAILQEIPSLGTKTFKEIDPSDVERLKWAGIYAQRPKDGHFLVRVKLPSGRLNAEQARVLAQIAKDYGQNDIQITIRQAVQIHNITLKEAPDILARINQVHLSSVEACGDVPRTILGNPLMGLDPEELLDTTELVDKSYRYFLGNPEYSNLPRKFKLSISSNPHDTGFARINDLALVPAKKEDILGFHAYIGGGLSDQPKLAQKLPFFVRPEDVFRLAKATVTLFREEGYRTDRHHCRLKFLVEDWGIEKVAIKLEELAGAFERGGEEVRKPWNRGVFYGIHEQKQKGLYYAGVCIPAGYMTGDDLEIFATLAEKYGDGTLRTTNSQNILLANIPEENVEALQKEEIFTRYTLTPQNFSGYAASCTGLPYCNFAPVDTKKRLQTLVDALDKAFPNIGVPVRINMTGCAHSCAHPQIADIGFTGGKAKVGDTVTDAFTVHIGGALGMDVALGTVLQGKVPAEKLFVFVSALLKHYLAVREEQEPFYATARRLGSKPWQEILNQFGA